MLPGAIQFLGLVSLESQQEESLCKGDVSV